MISRFKSNALFLSIFAVIYFIAWFLQTKLYFNWDVSWLMEASRRLVEGGTYATQFFENNPPLILYLYVPPVVMTKLTHLNIMYSLQIYVFILATISLFLCSKLLREIIPQADAILRKYILISLSIIFLILPLYEFGQREHLLIIFIMPYLFLLTARLQGSTFNPYFAASIGCWAALGFFIKPHFLLTLVLLEIYYICKKKSLLAPFRIETISMLCVLMLYITVILVRHADYLFIVIPYALHWCAYTDNFPLRMVIDNQFIFYSLISLACYLFFYKTNPYRMFSTVLLLSMLGFLVSFIAQRTLWYYHVYPVFALTTLGIILQLAVRSLYPYKKADYILMGLLAAAVIAFLYIQTPSIWTSILYYQYAYYGYFAVVLAFYVYSNKIITNYYQTLLYTIIIGSILWICYLFSLYVLVSELYAYRFILTSIALLFCSMLFIFKTSRQNYHQVMSYTLSILMFSFPVYFCLVTYTKFTGLSTGMHKIISFMDTYAKHKSVYFFTTDIKCVFPVINYSEDTVSKSRFSHFFGLGGMVRQAYFPTNSFPVEWQVHDSNFLINMVAEDLTIKKPDLVFVDINQKKRAFSFVSVKQGKFDIKFFPFDYINYFSQNENFRNAWKHYKYLTTLEGQAILLFNTPYKFAVYQYTS